MSASRGQRCRWRRSARVQRWRGSTRCGRSPQLPCSSPGFSWRCAGPMPGWWSCRWVYRGSTSHRGPARCWSRSSICCCSAPWPVGSHNAPGGWACGTHRCRAGCASSRWSAPVRCWSGCGAALSMQVVRRSGGSTVTSRPATACVSARVWRLRSRSGRCCAMRCASTRSVRWRDSRGACRPACCWSVWRCCGSVPRTPGCSTSRPRTERLRFSGRCMLAAPRSMPMWRSRRRLPRGACGRHERPGRSPLPVRSPCSPRIRASRPSRAGPTPAWVRRSACSGRRRG